MIVPYPTFDEENILWNNGITHVAGVDEVGRGAFAGPVVTAAVILPRDFPVDIGIHDSKLVKKEKREELAEIIKENAVSYAITEVCVPCINEEGIGKSTQKSFRHSIMNLSIPPDFILMDAFFITGITPDIQKPIIKGDQKSLSIAAASIIAKVYRDTLMEQLDLQFPDYQFGTHKGYGTALHRSAIKNYGLTSLHRTSFNLEKYR